jgi:hypothetical protein
VVPDHIFASKCPPGWFFVPIEEAQYWSKTFKSKILAALRDGRKNWLTREDSVRASKKSKQK